MTSKALSLTVQASQLGDRGNHLQAIELLEQALPLCTTDEDRYAVLYERGFQRLLNQDYKQGWIDWRARISHRLMADAFKKVWPGLPEWDGTTNQTVLVCAEKGLGDTVLFARYLNVLWDRGCTVQFVTSKNSTSIAPIIACYPGVEAVFMNDDNIPQTAQAWIGIESLPLFTDEIPAPFQFPLLPKRTSYRPRVGLCWRGSPFNIAKDRQPYGVELWEKITRVEGIDFVSLQLGEQGACINYLPPNSSMMQTVQLIQTCDLVISMDTSVAHMAGSVGVETWIPLHQLNYWPWVKSGEEGTIWYPSVRVFRQGEAGWPEVFTRMSGVLADFA